MSLAAGSSSVSGRHVAMTLLSSSSRPQKTIARSSTGASVTSRTIRPLRGRCRIACFPAPGPRHRRHDPRDDLLVSRGDWAGTRDRGLLDDDQQLSSSSLMPSGATVVDTWPIVGQANELAAPRTSRARRRLWPASHRLRRRPIEALSSERSARSVPMLRRRRPLGWPGVDARPCGTAWGFPSLRVAPGTGFPCRGQPAEGHYPRRIMTRRAIG